MRIVRFLSLLVLAPLLASCAGGWRGGVAPAEWAGTTTTASAATAAAPAASRAKAVASNAKATHGTADGAVFIWTGEGATVSVAGEFNAWNTSADPMAKQADGSFKLEKKLNAGSYQYKFVVDGSNWKADPNATTTADDGYGGKNAVVVVGDGTAAAAPAAAPVAKPAAAGAGVAVAGDAATFKWSGGGASANVAGEFNAWSTSADPMVKQADGSFTLVKKLAPGRYQYKFVVDGSNWKEDPNAKETVDDGYGGKNAVVVIGGGAAAAPAPAAAPAAKPAAAGAGVAVTGDAVTFKWSGGGASANLAGEFNAWSTSADPMTKQTDGSFTLVKKLAPGRYQYKFVVDGSNWKEDPNAKETVDDGYGGKNAVVVVGGGAAAAPAPAAAPAAAAPSAVMTGDAVTFKWSGGGASANVAGEFNAWSTSADPMVKQADGSFTLVKKLAPGRYQYKFVVDGSNWKEDPNAKETADDGYGGKNAVMVVGGGTAAPGAASAAAPASAARPLAAGAKGRAPQLTAKGVVFTFAGAAKATVSLCGDFNSWATTTDPMTQQADGTWTITKKLAAGKYGYKFLVDGATWKQDDGNPLSSDDGFGGKNSVVTVQ